MKKDHPPIQLDGAITLAVSPQDSLLWKLSMILEAAHPDSEQTTIEAIAGKYGYTREYFYQLLEKLKSQGSQSLADRPTGPKTRYKRTPEVTKQILRHRFLDPEANCEVIAQKMVAGPRTASVGRLGVAQGMDRAGGSGCGTPHRPAADPRDRPMCRAHPTQELAGPSGIGRSRRAWDGW